MMKRFVLKGILFLFLLVCMDLSGGYIFDFLRETALKKNPSKMTMEYAMESVDQEVIVVGSSRAQRHYVPDILQDSMGMTVYNIGKGGFYFLYQCCVVHEILNRTNPKIIIWDMEPTLLSKPRPSEISNLSYLGPYYDSSAYYRAIMEEMCPSEKYKMQSRLYRYNSHSLHYFSKSLAVKKNIKSVSGYIPLPVEGYEYPSLQELQEADSMWTETEKRFVGIIRQCQQNNVRLIASFSPKYVKSNYRETQVYRRLCSLLETHRVSLIDCYNESDFLNDPTLFKDRVHLNDRGARLFTTKWIEKYKARQEENSLASADRAAGEKG